MGRVFFWLLWPAIWLYSPLFRRVRVVIEHEGSLVLVKNSFGPDYWQLPGGGIKFGESVQAAAAREIHEELGITANPDEMKLLSSDVKIVRQFGLLLRYQFVHFRLSKQQELEISSELTAAEWVEKSDIKRMKYAQEVTDGMSLL